MFKKKKKKERKKDNMGIDNIAKVAIVDSAGKKKLVLWETYEDMKITGPVPDIYILNFFL